jgi:hypothetical protein
MSMNTEKRINEVMESLEGISPAAAPPFLYTRIQQKISLVRNEYTPARLVWLAAASFLVLLLLNLGAVKNSLSVKGSNELQNLSSGYNLMNENPINYN